MFNRYMLYPKKMFKLAVFHAVKDYAGEAGADISLIDEEALRVEDPPNRELGDMGCPMFIFARIFKKSPADIAREVASRLNAEAENARRYDMGGTFDMMRFQMAVGELGTYVAAGPYVNLRLNKAAFSYAVLSEIADKGDTYGSFNSDGVRPREGERVMIEFSAPNTNKPLHLGHLRNDALGESVSRILKKAGSEVYKVNLVNNRGVHICKSMLAYKLFHEKNGDTPESLGMKGDHFVGQCYVEFDKYMKEHPEAQSEAENMLVKWEEGDEMVRALWKTMNEWTLSGLNETYRRTGIAFDRVYFESDTYLKGKDEILKGLDRGVFFKAPDGSIRCDVTEAVGKGKDEDAHEKVLLRKDGTSVYITQDIGTAISRHADWDFNKMVYVVASEQNYHFKILFYILRKLGFDWAKNLIHLSYGLVNLPEGRMKSREGTVVDADDLLDSLHADALKIIEEREGDTPVEDADDVAEKVSLSALHYYLLNVSPQKDMLFKSEESLSFNGNTGPYLQYMGARISSILRKARDKGLTSSCTREGTALLTTASEWDLVMCLSRFPDTVERAAEALDPSIIAVYLYDTAKAFSAFYRDCPIVSLTDGERTLAETRLFLAECTLTVLKSAMALVLVPFLDKM